MHHTTATLTSSDDGRGLGQTVTLHDRNANILKELKHGETRRRTTRRHIPGEKDNRKKTMNKTVGTR